MALFTDGDPSYVDAEDTNEHIREMVTVLAQHEYDHDGHNGLPARPDAVDYINNILCRPRKGYIRASGFDYPVVRLGGDGTFLLIWSHCDRTLSIDVPARHVVILKRIDRSRGGQTAVAMRLGDETLETADEIATAFRWLAEEDDE